MAPRVFDKLWHRILKRPYILSKTIDEGGGVAVVLLHGLGRTGRVWEHVIAYMLPLNVRVVAFDLLGFGASPKPDWLKYEVDDHAEAVIASINKLHLKQPVILVGHSMGCLVAVRVARLRPDFVKHLVLYEMPLYEGLPEKRRYRLRTDIYFRIYQKIVRFQPAFNAANARRIQRLAQKVIGFEVTRETWLPFVRSLENTVMRQKAAEDIKQLAVPMEVIYGTFDMLVIRGKPQKFFGEDNERLTAHTIRSRHNISPKASRFLVRRVESALQNPGTE